MSTIEKCIENIGRIKESAMDHGNGEMFMQLSDCEAWLRYLRELEKQNRLPDLEASGE